MIRFLVSALMFFASAAIGLAIAVALVDGMSATVSGFLIAAGIFAVLQAVLGPFLATTARRSAPAILGGIGLITTVVSLAVTTAVSDALTIEGLTAWVVGSIIVWLATMIATLLLPLILVKAGVEAARDRRSDV